MPSLLGRFNCFHQITLHHTFVTQVALKLATT